MVLPGHHRLYSPWVPPSHLSDQVLATLENALLNTLKDMFQQAHDRSHTSSPAKSDVSDDDPVTFLEMRQQSRPSLFEYSE